MTKEVLRRHVHMIQPVNRDMSRKVSQFSEPKGQNQKPFSKFISFWTILPSHCPIYYHHMPLVFSLFFFVLRWLFSLVKLRKSENKEASKITFNFFR